MREMRFRFSQTSRRRRCVVGVFRNRRILLCGVAHDGSDHACWRSAGGSCEAASESTARVTICRERPFRSSSWVEQDTSLRRETVSITALTGKGGRGTSFGSRRPELRCCSIDCGRSTAVLAATGLACRVAPVQLSRLERCGRSEGRPTQLPVRLGPFGRVALAGRPTSCGGASGRGRAGTPLLPGSLQASRSNRGILWKRSRSRCFGRDLLP